jgi:peroxiredoxin/mono/diheme cytochrome c family protein
MMRSGLPLTGCKRFRVFGPLIVCLMVSQVPPRARAEETNLPGKPAIGAATAEDTPVGADTQVESNENPLARKTLPEFVLQDHRGHEYRLADFAHSRYLVVAFLGTECPMAKLYAPRLQALADEYKAQGVGFVGVDANAQDALSDLAAYARQHDIRFPLLKDVGNRLADQLGARRTPEVFVVDSERRVRYWGRIDDQYGVGFARSEPQQHDLRHALDELLAGHTVSTPITPAAGCLIGRVRVRDEQAQVTYSNQIARLFQRRCVECHRDGDIAPFALDDYEAAAGWAEMIAEVVRENRMPPWHANAEPSKFSNDRQLTDEEKSLIEKWVSAGAPQGDPAMLPPSRQFTKGWQLPREPDLVVPMSDEPHPVPAEGTVEYQFFRVDPQLTEDKWIEAVEVVPGNRAVVHHVLVFAESPGDEQPDIGGGVRGFLAAYVPGLRSVHFPPGMAKFLPAGSKLVFQLHYTPNGSPQTDVSKIAFVFTSRDQVTHEVKTVSAFQPMIRIPAAAADHVESTKTKLHRDAKLLALMPHLHLRGKAFRYLLKRPGDELWTTLLDVPRYDFNWQTNYQLAEPLDLPDGSFIKCVAHYDNSPDNPNNPDPEQSVRWGEQTWDEMMIGYFDVAVPLARDQGIGVTLDGRNWRSEEFILQMDKNDDLQLQVEELPEAMQRAANRADVNGDGRIATDELQGLLRTPR